jgi:predicted lipoprotein with Yx(FWY)xxD motif
MSTTTRALTCAIAVTMFSLLAPGCTGTVATSESLGLAQDTSIGPVLVAPDGRTLYTYDKDDKASRIAQACVPQHGRRCSRRMALRRRTASL